MHSERSSRRSARRARNFVPLGGPKRTSQGTSQPGGTAVRLPWGALGRSLGALGALLGTLGALLGCILASKMALRRPLRYKLRFRRPLLRPKGRKYASRPKRESIFHIQEKPDYHGTGSACGARAASKASEARAPRSQQTLQAETEKMHQQEQEPPRAGQQEHRDSEPGHSVKPRVGAARRRLGA